ncbi:MAG: glycoside hydrolase family 2 TIM barrel-domain containing protein [Clostridia bacterium]
MRKDLLINDGWLFKEGEFLLTDIRGHFDTYMISKAQCGRGPLNPLFYDEDFKEVTIPHDYVLKGSPCKEYNESQGSYFRDTAFYRRHFVMPCSFDDKRVLLYFEGAGQHTEVWVNSQFAGDNDSMYNSFYMDITPYLLDDNAVNTIAVKIENKKIEGWWYEGAGIYRDVHLVITEKIAVDHWGVWVNPIKKDEKNWTVPVETTVYSQLCESKNITVKQEIFDADNNVIASVLGDFSVSGEENVLTQELAIENPKLWDIDTCYLHSLKTTIIADTEVFDEVVTSFGFRTLKFDGQEGFFLNDKHIKLRGACIHQDHGNLGVAVPNSIIEFRLRKMQECGMNCVRLAHNNHAPALTEICDKIGMLVLDENRWFNYSDRTKKELVSMLKRDRNNPSVIAWSIGNEEPLQNTKLGEKLVDNMRRLVRKYDTTRPVTIALNGGFYDSYAAKASDVVGVNYNLKGYDKFPEAHPNKCILATESVASNNNRAVYFIDDPENFKSKYATAYDEARASFGSSFKDAVEASETHPFVGGTFIWSGVEYRGEAQWPKLFSGSAPIDNTGFEKDSFYLLASYWKKEPILHLMPHWNFKDRIGETIKVFAYTNQDEVELFLNGKSLGKKSRVGFSNPSWDVVYEEGELKAVAFVDGKETICTSHRTTGDAVKLHLYEESKGTTNSGVDTVIVNAYVTDENADMIPTAEHRVHFVCDENAEIIAVSAGDPLCHEDPRTNDKKMFGGRVQVILRVKEGAKSVKVMAETKEISLSAEIEIAVSEKNPPEKLAVSYRKLSIGTFRIWDKTAQNSEAVDAKYNFDDMNSSQPITLPHTGEKSSDEYKILTAKTVMPICESKLSLRFTALEGSGKIKIFHDDNCWPHPTPDEFISNIYEFSFDEKTDYTINLEKFASNEKFNLVIVYDDKKEFNLDDLSFSQAE